VEPSGIGENTDDIAHVADPLKRNLDVSGIEAVGKQISESLDVLRR